MADQSPAQDAIDAGAVAASALLADEYDCWDEDRQCGDFSGLRHGREGVSEIEGSVWFGPGAEPFPDSTLYVRIKGAGTFAVDSLPAAIEEARRDRFGKPRTRGKFDSFTAADLRLLKMRMPEWAEAIDRYLEEL